jgi:broad specificity phosphatase PhoE
LTTDNEAGVATGWLDGRLSEHGKVLATELGRRRRNDGIAEGERARRVGRPFSGGESYLQVVARVAGFLEELRATGTGCGCWSVTRRPVGPWTTCWPAPTSTSW